MPKKIHHNSIGGQPGIHAIEAVVLQLGYVFYPTGALEAGIDGFIGRNVVNHYLGKDARSGGAYFRHSAFEG